MRRTKEKHGMTYSPEYQCWSDMRKRCTDKKGRDYKYYGGRGISVCPQWDSSFVSFFSDMGHRPSTKHSIDRIDNNGNYEPDNCRWATQAEQSANKRPYSIAKNNTSGLTGVCRTKTGYQVTFRNKYIGHFDNIFDAACLRIAAINRKSQ